MNIQITTEQPRNRIRLSKSRKVFLAFLYILMITVSLMCLLPFVNLLAISFSEGKYVNAGSVTFWPKGFNLSSYQYILQDKNFFRAFFIAIERTLLGTAINVVLIVLTAYPLSRGNDNFKGKTAYMVLFVGAMLFVPALIPLYMVVRNMGMLDSIWALVLPTALPVFNMILMMNFFRGLPKGLDEAAYLDGAGHWTILWRICIPLSKPAIATVTLFCIIHHWNSWFDGMLYMNTTEKYPLQSYLQTIVVSSQQLFKNGRGNDNMVNLLKIINNDTSKAAQLFLGMLPVLLIYPLLQKYFTTGLTAGAIKE